MGCWVMVFRINNMLIYYYCKVMGAWSVQDEVMVLALLPIMLLEILALL